MRPLSVLLVAAILVSAMALVYVRYESRIAFAELHRLDRERDAMNVEYGQLLAERATWSRDPEVESRAAAKLGMSRPASDDVVTLVVPRAPTQ